MPYMIHVYGRTVVGVGLVTMAAVGIAPAAIAQPISPAADGTGTRVTVVGDRFDIDRGSFSADGANQFHSFQQFGLGAGQTANFIAPPETINILGRVTGGDASYINGQIQVTGANANLYLTNPAGILFGSDVQLDVPASFTATTATRVGFAEGWFDAIHANAYADLTGTPSAFAFDLANPAAIANTGTLQVAPGSTLSLTGGTVLNTGTLTAPDGGITLTAVPGTSVLRLNQTGMVLGLDINPAAGDTAGFTTLTPQSLPDLLTGADPTVATDITLNPDGSISLSGSPAALPSGAGVTLVAGEVDVSSAEGSGGRVQVLGDRVGVINAEINADGHQGGGTIQVGGDVQGGGTIPTASRTLVNAGARLTADAIAHGDGGEIIVWADGTTGFYGAASARGGAAQGNGGFVEVSGAENLAFQGQVDLAAPVGTVGEFLLDPLNINIVAGNSAPQDGALADNTILSSESPGATFTISAGALTAITGNIFLEATGNITVANGVSLNFATTGDPAAPGGSIRFNADRFNGDGVLGQFRMDPTQTINTNGRDLSIQAHGYQIGNITTNGGDIDLANAGDPGASLTLTRDTVLNVGSGGGTIRIDDLDINSDNLATPRSLTLLADQGSIISDFRTRVGDAVSLRDFTVQTNGFIGLPNQISVTNTVDSQSSVLRMFNQQITAGNLINIQTNNDLSLSEVTFSAGNEINLQSGGSMVVESSTMGALSGVRLQTDSTGNPTEGDRGIVVSGGSLNASGLVDLQSDTDILVRPNLTLTDVPENDALISAGVINLRADQGLNIRDTATGSVRLSSGSNITAQGNNSLQIWLNHQPDSVWNTAANTTLVSDNPIIFDVGTNPDSPIATIGGSFTAQTVSGAPGTLINQSGNTLLSVAGDVSFGNYIGRSLKIEALGSIIGGDIRITAPNPTLTGIDPDLPWLTDAPSLILRAGLSSLTNAPNLPVGAANGTAFTSSSPSSPGNIQVGNIDTSTLVASPAGVVILDASGSVTTGTITTTAQVGSGGAVTIAAAEAVTTGAINTATQAASREVTSTGELIGLILGGDLTVNAGGAVQTGNLTTNGGQVQLQGQQVTTGNIEAYATDTNLEDSIPAGLTQGGVQLVSTEGDIVVGYIRAGVGGVDITAAERFQAIAADPTVNFALNRTGGFSVEQDIRIKDSPEIIAFLVSQGFDQTELEQSDVVVTITNSASLPASIIAYSSDSNGIARSQVIIRHGGRGITPANLIGEDPLVQVLGGDADYSFVTGPFPIVTPGAEFIPVTASNAPTDLAGFDPTDASATLTLRRNADYRFLQIPDEFPATASGTVGAIVVGNDINNAQFYSSLYNQPFIPGVDPGSGGTGGGGTGGGDPGGGTGGGTGGGDSGGGGTGGGTDGGTGGGTGGSGTGSGDRGGTGTTSGGGSGSGDRGGTTGGETGSGTGSGAASGGTTNGGTGSGTTGGDAGTTTTTNPDGDRPGSEDAVATTDTDIIQQTTESAEPTADDCQAESGSQTSEDSILTIDAAIVVISLEGSRPPTEANPCVEAIAAQE